MSTRSRMPSPILVCYSVLRHWTKWGTFVEGKVLHFIISQNTSQFSFFLLIRCKCSFMNMLVIVTIKKTCGKVVKTFSLTGANSIDEVLLWIWRDLFVSLLANGAKRDKKMVPEMLVDIERVFGWNALERLLYGGKYC
jgi:hypothetical protein